MRIECYRLYSSSLDARSIPKIEKKITSCHVNEIQDSNLRARVRPSMSKSVIDFCDDVIPPYTYTTSQRLARKGTFDYRRGIFHEGSLLSSMSKSVIDFCDDVITPTRVAFSHQ